MHTSTKRPAIAATGPLMTRRTALTTLTVALATLGVGAAASAGTAAARPAPSQCASLIRGIRVIVPCGPPASTEPVATPDATSSPGAATPQPDAGS